MLGVFFGNFGTPWECWVFLVSRVVGRGVSRRFAGGRAERRYGFVVDVNWGRRTALLWMG